MPKTLKLNEDEVIAEEVFKVLVEERFARIAERLHARGLSMRSAAVACAVQARQQCAGPADKVVALALIRLVQLSGHAPDADDVARYENAGTSPVPTATDEA